MVAAIDAVITAVSELRLLHHLRCEESVLKEDLPTMSGVAIRVAAHWDCELQTRHLTVPLFRLVSQPRAR